MVLKEVDEPIAEKNLVKIKVHYSGLCGTDLHTFKGEYASSKVPLTLGHEFSGVVTEIGPDVKHIRVGDRVTSETTFEICGTCDHCKEQEYNLCSTRKGIGTQVNGSFAEYVVSKEERVHVLPENVSLLAASITEPLACAVHAAMEKTQVQKGDVVVVFGPGPIGLMVAMVAKALEATVILAGTSKDKERFLLAEQLHVDRIVDQTEEDLSDIVMEMTQGKGADKVFECSGVIHALNKGLFITKRKGEIVQLGIFSKELNTINLSCFHERELVYIGSRSQKPSTWKLTLDLMEKGLVFPEKLITMQTDLSNWEEAFEKSANCEELKIVFKCSDIPAE